MEGGETVIYVNKYYEKNLTTGTTTTYYYLGDKLVAFKWGAAQPEYVHLDHLGGTNAVTSSSGSKLAKRRYYPYGETEFSYSSLDTDKEFTGQRHDGTGLYYYNARYYDPTLGRFISPDTFVQTATAFDQVTYALTVNLIAAGLGDSPVGSFPQGGQASPANPQALNRYSYVFNNPLRYTDPTGWDTRGYGFGTWIGFCAGVSVDEMVVFDDHGGIAIVKSKWVGAEVGASAGVAAQYQYTTAETFYELEGIAEVAGGSVGMQRGLGVGVEPIVGNEWNWHPDDGLSYLTETYTGTNIYVGVQLSALIGEGHAAMQHTEIVEVIREPSSEQVGYADTWTQVQVVTEFFIGRFVASLLFWD